MIDDLLGVLAAAGLEPCADELLDALWLAGHIGTPTDRQGAPEHHVEPSSVARSDPPSPSIDEDVNETPAPAEVPGRPPGDLYAASSETSTNRARGLVARSPAVPALRDQLDISRALRPLGRRVPSRSTFLVDEDATAARIAEEGLWAPVLRPAPERWLTLILIVDSSPSMTLWQRTAAELRALAEWLGAFRQIRLHMFDSSVTGPLPDVLAGLASGPQAAVVLTDAVGSGWRDGRVDALLRRWGRVVPTSVFTVLPQRMWPGTGLAVTTGDVRVAGSGKPNHEWDTKSGDNVPIPVFELSARWLTRWSGLVTGAPGRQRSALLISSREDTTSASPVAASASARELVASFRSAASPPAFKLACYLSATWLTLPVMRLIQHVMLPSSDISHLAEFLLGGLLWQASDGSAPEEVEYELLPGVREELNDHLLRDDLLTVLHETSLFVNERFGQAFDFAAMVADPDGVELSGVLGTPGRPLAQVAASVLSRLGGRYRVLAERLATVRAMGPDRTGPALRSGPAPIRYLADGFWFQQRAGRTYRVGVTARKIDGIQHLSRISWPEVGTVARRGDSIVRLTSRRVVLDLVLPVGAVVRAVNSKAAQDVSAVRKEPEGNGWLIEFETEEPGFFENLMSEAEYADYLRSMDGHEPEYTAAPGPQMLLDDIMSFEPPQTRVLRTRRQLIALSFSSGLRRLVRETTGSIASLAHHTGVPPTTLGNLINGRFVTPPPFDRVELLVSTCARIRPETSSHAFQELTAEFDVHEWRQRYEKMVAAFADLPASDNIRPPRVLLCHSSDSADLTDSVRNLSQFLQNCGISNTMNLIEDSRQVWPLLTSSEIDDVDFVVVVLPPGHIRPGNTEAGSQPEEDAATVREPTRTTSVAPPLVLVRLWQFAHAEMTVPPEWERATIQNVGAPTVRGSESLLRVLLGVPDPAPQGHQASDTPVIQSAAGRPKSQLDRILKPGVRAAVLCCGFDDFETITAGRGSIGSELLSALKGRLTSGLPAGCSVTWDVGDELWILCEDVEAAGGLRRLASRVDSLFGDRVDLQRLGAGAEVRASIGAALSAAAPAAFTADELLTEAKSAMLKNRLAREPVDLEVDVLESMFRRTDPEGTRFAAAIRRSFEHHLNGSHTGRFRSEQLKKAEKSAVSTSIEIELGREFAFDEGGGLDFTVGGIEFDFKYSSRMAWMFPQETRSHICLVVSASHDEATWSAGLVRADPRFLSAALNRDLKATLNPEGRAAIRWLHKNARLPENVLAQMSEAEVSAIFALESSQARINELFLRTQGRWITRATVATAAMSENTAKRIRTARRVLAAQGLVVLGKSPQHVNAAQNLGLPAPLPGQEWISFRVIPLEEGDPSSSILIAEGRRWRLANPWDPVVAAPVMS